MRVAMLGPYPHDEHNLVGGVEAVIVCLLKHLAALPDLELHMVTCQPNALTGGEQTSGGLQTHHERLQNHHERLQSHHERRPQIHHEQVNRANWTVHHLPREKWGRITFHLRERRRIVALLRELHPDVVHAHTTGLHAAAALDSGWPAVITVHGLSFREAEIAQSRGERWRGFLDSAFERRVLRRARHLIVISPYVEQECAGLTRARTYPIENPVEETFFAVTEKPQAHRVLFAGRLIPRKGVQQLLVAFHMIAKEYPQIELRLAGEEDVNSPYATALHRYVEEQGLTSRVHFLGSLRINQMAREYGASAFLVLPSKQETAPVVIAEAMAVGRPVVATRVGGIPYLVEHGRSGLLVDCDDVEGLAASMRRLLDNEALRLELGQRAQAEALRRFRGDLVAEQTYRVYKRLAGQV